MKAPTWDGLRPTSDKLRETLFNVLAPTIAGARVLDGYAGTGAIGIEAISRGAATVTFVETDRRAQALIDENLSHCGVAKGCAIIRDSVVRAVDSLRAAGATFDIAVFDPPYDRPADRDLHALDGLIAPGGVVVIEHATRQPVPDAIGRLVKTRDLNSGDAALSFYSCRP